MTDSRKGVKLKLASLCTGAEALDLFKNIAEKAHDVKTAAYLLAKHYVLTKLHCNSPLPVDLELLFQNVISSLSTKRPRSDETSDRRQELRTLLRRDFPCTEEGGPFCVDTEYLAGNWAAYEAKNYATHVENNVKANFKKCLFSFVEIELGLDHKDPLELATIKRTIAGVVQGEPFETLGLEPFPEPYALPTRPRVIIDSDNPALLTVSDEDLPTMELEAHVAEAPMMYFAPMLHMYSRLEHHGCTKKVLSLLPLVTSQVPGHTMIDTAILSDFMPKSLLQGRTKGSFKSAWSTPGARGKQARDGDGNRRLTDGQADLWRLVFNLDLCKPRGGDWAFDNMIQTDGLSCNLMLRTRSDQLAGRRRVFKPTPSNYLSEIRAVTNPRVVGVDPGKNNIIYCVDDATPEYDATHRKLVDQGHTFRYTRAQRNFETKKRSRREEAERYKRQNGSEAFEWEQRLRGHSSKTTDVSCFIRFLEMFIASRSALRAFYRRMVHRRDRFESYRLRQKSESKLIAAFKHQMCCKSKAARERTIIAFGNGSRQNLKNSAPGPSSSIRRLFLRNHFKVLDIHEAYTSKRCFHCKQTTSENGPHRFLPGAPNQRPAQVWGVRRCCGCDRTWNRDYHACLNIAVLARELLAGRPRPSYLCKGSSS